MLEIIARDWWVLALRGVLAVAFGIMALIWPGVTLGVLVLVFGAYALVDGMLALVAALFGSRLVSGRRGWLVLEGIVGIAVGVAAFVWPSITSLALLWLIAAWVIMIGLLEAAAAVVLRGGQRHEWLLVLGGVLSVAFGLYLAVWPQQGALAVVWLIGLYAILFGTALTALAVRMREHAMTGRQLPFAVSAVLVVAAALAASGCDAVDEGRTASGETASKRVEAAGVTGLEVDSGFDVRVALGQPEAATVTYDDNLASLLDVGVDGRTLRIRLQPHDRIGSSPNLTAQVTIGRLEAIRVAGDSTVTVTGRVPGPALRLEISRGSRVAADLGLDRADATLSGASRLELTGIAGRLHADGSGASNLELAGLRLHDLDIQLSGASHANVQADRTIAAQLSGASHLIYTGSPRFTRRDISGASAIRPA